MSADQPATLRSVDATHVERRAARGGVITALAQTIRGISDGVGTLILARTLLPADFGLVDMIVSITGVIDMLKDFGLSSATIQRDKLEHDQVSLLLWINVAIGAVLTLVTMAAAPFIALTYGRPELQELTLALSSSTLLGALAVQHLALLRRELRFEVIAQIEIGSSLGATALAVWLAFQGAGAWALVARQVVRLGVQAALTWALCSFRPSRPKRANIGELLRFGTHVSGFQVLNYLERNLDNVLVGRFAGAEALGFYSKAYDFMRLPLNQVNAPVGAVMVSALSRLADQPERYRNAYRAVATLLMLTVVPLAPIAILSADWLIPAVLGPRWSGAVPLFQVLALTLVARPLGNTMGWLFISQARTAELWRWGLVGGAIALVSFLVGLPWGALGVATSYCAFDIVVRTPILFVWVGRRGPVSVRDMLVCMLPAWALACIVGLVYGVLGPLSGLTGGARFAVFTPLSLLVGAGLMLATPWGRQAARSGASMFRTLRQGGTA